MKCPILTSPYALYNLICRSLSRSKTNIMSSSIASIIIASTASLLMLFAISVHMHHSNNAKVSSFHFKSRDSIKDRRDVHHICHEVITRTGSSVVDASSLSREMARLLEVSMDTDTYTNLGLKGGATAITTTAFVRSSHIGDV